ncbi:MAG: hypothetical protein PSV18_01850 [Methylobacter sp.]|nr:hypothetical protein [Candidatus Methylobacter titanis]
MSLNLKIKLSNDDRICTGIIGSVTLAPKAVVINTINGDLLVWLKYKDDDTAQKVRAEINRVIDSAEEGTHTKADWSFLESAKTVKT